MYKNSFNTSQRTMYVSIIYINQLQLYRDINVVYCENHTKHIHSTGKLSNITISDTDSHRLILKF
jgi:hypothetical protein